MLLSEQYRTRLLKLANLSEIETAVGKDRNKKEETKDGIHLPELFMEKENLNAYLIKVYGLRLEKM